MIHFKTVSEFHKFRQLPMPEHPLISIIDMEKTPKADLSKSVDWYYDFYCIALKRFTGFENVKLRYGQQLFDFDGGLMSFVAPNQVLGITVDSNEEITEMNEIGWMMLIHPDFFWKTSLSGAIRQYDFWQYSVNEALFLSEKEEAVITGIIQNIRNEYHSNIDDFSHNIIISQIETLLNYADRFYHRQFITRKKDCHNILNQLESLLSEYFDKDNLIDEGLPTVQYISDKLNVSVNYLSRLLKTITGKSTQQHIHDKMIEISKDRLSTTTLSVSEIAYGLGFEHLQSFSKLFKAKTNQTPMEFRSSFSPDNKLNKRN